MTLPVPRRTAIITLLLLPGMAVAQTAEIQHQVDAELRFQRFLRWIEAVSGLPAAVALSAILVLLSALAASIAYRYTRNRTK